MTTMYACRMSLAQILVIQTRETMEEGQSHIMLTLGTEESAYHVENGFALACPCTVSGNDKT